jgi:hypothetical protein
MDKLDRLIKIVQDKHNNIIIASDYSAKSTVWTGDKTDKRGRILMETLVTNQIVLIKVNTKYTFEKGKNKSFLDIKSVNHKLSFIKRQNSAYF